MRKIYETTMPLAWIPFLSGNRQGVVGDRMVVDGERFEFLKCQIGWDGEATYLLRSLRDSLEYIFTDLEFRTLVLLPIHYNAIWNELNEV
jgi:hypothetical protein